MGFLSLEMIFVLSTATIANKKQIKNHPKGTQKSAFELKKLMNTTRFNFHLFRQRMPDLGLFSCHVKAYLAYPSTRGIQMGSKRNSFGQQRVGRDA